MDTETRDLFFKWVRGDEWEELARAPESASIRRGTVSATE